MALAPNVPHQIVGLRCRISFKFGPLAATCRSCLGLLYLKSILAFVGHIVKRLVVVAGF